MKHTRQERPESMQLSRCIKIIAMVTFSFATSVAHAAFFDGVSAEVGDGHEALIYKLAVQKNFTGLCSFLIDHNVHPYWELSLADVRESKFKNITGQSNSTFGIGITPVLRWQPNMERGLGIEVAIGANYFTERYNDAGAVMGTNFQFGDHIGVAYKFNKRFEILAKFQHYSNAGISQPNPAVNFGIVKLAYTF